MDKILEVKKLKISFRTSGGTLKAVRDISFDLERSKTLAIVGESGSGKSVTSKAIIGILAGNSIVESGEILYDGKDLLRIPEDEMHRLRGDKISMIFQDPLSSLNPIVKIGKQITEAMLLKNKTSRKEAKAEFDKTLELCRQYMLKAEGASKEEHINEMVKTFRDFCKKGTELENEYNLSSSAALEALSGLEDLSFNISKKQEVDAKRQLTVLIKTVDTVKDPYLLGESTEKLNAVKSGLQNAASVCKSRKHKLDDAESEKALSAIEDAKKYLQEITGATRPDFFSLGYCALHGGNVKLNGRGVEAMNAECEKTMNEGFMNEFMGLIESSVRYSHDEALSKKKSVIEEITKARNFYTGDFDRKEGLDICKTLSAKVTDSIDRQEIIKDSAAYAFGVSLRNAVEHFFSDQAHNVKEEKRFARQSAKRDRMIARGKTVEWKVVPKNIYEVSDLRENITTVLDRVSERYGEQVNAEIDFRARAQEVLNFLKDKDSAAVYRITKGMAKEKAIKLMEEVGIHEPRIRYNQYPFEFSGGMRQRIVIAIALAADPDILICDEPTTALDVTIQAQILELINRLKKERNLSVIFITHDLGVVANMADDIAVMYAGKIIEYGTADDIFYDPRHPYTWALLSSMPDLDTKEKLEAIPGTPPNMIYPPVGDAFADRNKYAMKIDFEQQPPMFKVSETHSAATWLLHPDAPKVEMPKIIADRIARMTKAGGDNDGNR